MSKEIIKKIQLGFISLSAVALLAACGDGMNEETPMTEDPVEDTQTPDEGANEEAPQEEETQQDEEANQDPNSQNDPGQEETTGQTEQEAVDTSNGILNVEFPITLDQARQTFYDTFGENINIDEIEFDEDRGVYEYDISGWDDGNEYDLEINAETGEITEQSTEKDDDQDYIIEFDNLITPQEAMQIAADESGSDYITEWSLEEEQGVTAYEIDIENGDDITVDAITGEVIDR